MSQPLSRRVFLALTGGALAVPSVSWAADAEEAQRIIVDIAQHAKCKHAVKSKSMTTEEIHLNPALEAAGIEVTETDYGEFILQIAKERPSHLVAPAVHHTRESIAAVLSNFVGTPCG